MGKSSSEEYGYFQNSKTCASPWVTINMIDMILFDPHDPRDPPNPPDPHDDDAEGRRVLEQEQLEGA